MKTQQPKSPHFKLVHLNIRSLRNTAHLTQLKEFLSKTKTEALTLSETWLNTTITNAEIYIEGYTLYRQDCAYIRNDIKVSKLKEISSISENYFHQLWLKLQSKKLKSIVICISYRPPECPLSCLETNLKPSFVQALLLITKQAHFYIGRSELQRYEGLSRKHSTRKFHVRDELKPINHNIN